MLQYEYLLFKQNCQKYNNFFNEFSYNSVNSLCIRIETYPTFIPVLVYCKHNMLLLSNSAYASYCSTGSLTELNKILTHFFQLFSNSVCCSMDSPRFYKIFF